MATRIDRNSILPDASVRWYAVYTKPSHEKRVAERLDVREIESFLPLYLSSRRRNNGCKVTLERPLFPGYIFVRLAADRRLEVLHLSGVVSLVGGVRWL